MSGDFNIARASAVPVVTGRLVIGDIVQRTRVSKLLRGARGARPADVAALTVIRSEILELDARIRVELSPPLE